MAVLGRVKVSKHTKLYLINFLMFWHQQIKITEKKVSYKILKKAVKLLIKYFKQNNNSQATPIVSITKEGCNQLFHYFMKIHPYFREINILLRLHQLKVIISLILFFLPHGNSLSRQLIVIQEKI